MVMDCLLSCHILLELAIIFHVPIIHCEIGSCDPFCPGLLFDGSAGLLDGRREGMHGLKGGNDIVNVRSGYLKEIKFLGIKQREKSLEGQKKKKGNWRKGWRSEINEGFGCKIWRSLSEPVCSQQALETLTPGVVIRVAPSTLATLNE